MRFPTVSVGGIADLRPVSLTRPCLMTCVFLSLTET